MYNKISNKQLSEIISEDMVVSECKYSSISVENTELNLSASLDLSTLKFDFSMWLGDNEEETELTEYQKDSIYYLLLNKESEDSQFDYADYEHAITLIHS